MSTPKPARKRLPVKPSQENLRKQAKHRAKVESIQLAQAQHLIATDYGCMNWAGLLQLVEAMNRSEGVPLMSSSGQPNKPMQAAARAKDLDAVRRLLDAGQYTQEELDSGLAGALWYGDAASQWPQMKAIADLLLDYGADVDAFLTTYGPIVFGTGECLQPESLQYLINHGANVAFGPVDTKYGKQCPLSYWLGTYVRGRNDVKHRGIEILLKHGAYVPPEVTPPVLAIHRGDARALAELLDADRSLVNRTFADMPYGNIHLRGATLLHCAVEFGEIECVEELLKRYADINVRADEIDGAGGQTPIFHAINTNGDGNFSVLEFLVKRLGQWIDMGVRATLRTIDGMTPPLTPLEYAEKAAREIDPKWAHYRPRVNDELKLLRSLDRRAELRRALERGDVATVARMLNESPEYLAPELWPPAYVAKSVELTRLLLDRGLDPNVSSAPRRAIDLAAYHALPEVVDLLIARGADVTSRNRLGETPMDLLEAYEPRPIGDPDARRVREALLKAGATYDIHAAVRSGDVEEVRRMLDADPSLVRTTEPWDPLFTAARAGRLEVARLLVARGAPVDGTNDKGNTPLWFACQSPANADDRMAVATLLLDAGADVNRRCEDGTTPLHFAAWRGPKAMVKLLLSRGARTFIEADQHKRAVDYARESKVNPERDATIALLTELQFDDDRFALAVALLDAGDVEGLRALLAEHPDLATMHATGESAMLQGYFTRPALIHFVACNPNRGPHMPRRILESTAAILDAGANVHAKCGVTGNGTVIGLVASSGPAHTDGLAEPLLELLVAHGADPSRGLDAAIENRLPVTVAALLRLGAAHTPKSAAGTGDVATLGRLLAAGMSDADRLGAFHSAAVNGQVAAADLLLDSGLDVNVRMPRPFDPTAIHEAAWFGHADLVDRLITRGADLTLRDTQYNATPADWARYAGRAELADRMGDRA